VAEGLVMMLLEYKYCCWFDVLILMVELVFEANERFWEVAVDGAR
jgi:hypothetical protein